MDDKLKELPLDEPTQEEAKAYLFSVVRRVGRKVQIPLEAPGGEFDERDIVTNITFPEDIETGPQLREFINSISAGTRGSHITEIYYAKIHHPPEVKVEKDEEMHIVLGGSGSLEETESPEEVFDPLERKYIGLAFYLDNSSFYVTKSDELGSLDFDGKEIEASPQLLVDFADYIAQAKQ